MRGHLEADRSEHTAPNSEDAVQELCVILQEGLIQTRSSLMCA